MKIYCATVKIASSPLFGGNLFVKNMEIKTLKVTKSSVKEGIGNCSVFFAGKNENNLDSGCFYDVGFSSVVTEHPFDKNSVLEIIVDGIFLSEIKKDKLERACLGYVKSHYPELVKRISFS